MPSDFTLIYKILKIVQKGLDYPAFSLENFNLKKLSTNETRFENIMIMLQKDGLVTGLEICEFVGGRSISANEIRLTMKGLEYLESNSFMKKASEVIGSITPFFN